MDLLKLQKKIVPEMIDLLELRYDILRSIYHNQPIGRRSLAQNLDMKERTIRTQINKLKELGLLNVESVGMYISKSGKKTIEDLSVLIHDLKGISKLEKDLKESLKIKNLIVVPGNIVEKHTSLDEISKASSLYLRKKIRDNFIIGITGGTTMANLAENMIEGKLAKDLLVIPARGGLGKDVETQANNIAAKLAEKLGGNYKLLHIPDHIDKSTLDAVLKFPDTEDLIDLEVLDLIEEIDILVFGIGRADTMADRRNLPKEKIDKLIEKGAVAEAFGHYFDIDGNEVWEYNTVGLSIERFKGIKEVIGVAAREEKAEAILSIARLNPDMTLITDEFAARKILEISN